jgi:hypothetical protein
MTIRMIGEVMTVGSKRTHRESDPCLTYSSWGLLGHFQKGKPANPACYYSRILKPKAFNREQFEPISLRSFLSPVSSTLFTRMALHRDFNLPVDEYTAEKWSALTSWLSEEVPRKGRMSDDQLTVRAPDSRSTTPIAAPVVSIHDSRGMQ